MLLKFSYTFGENWPLPPEKNPGYDGPDQNPTDHGQIMQGRRKPACFDQHRAPYQKEKTISDRAIQQV